MHLFPSQYNRTATRPLVRPGKWGCWCPPVEYIFTHKSSPRRLNIHILTTALYLCISNLYTSVAFTVIIVIHCHLDLFQALKGNHRSLGCYYQNWYSAMKTFEKKIKEVQVQKYSKLNGICKRYLLILILNSGWLPANYLFFIQNVFCLNLYWKSKFKIEEADLKMTFQR